MDGYSAKIIEHAKHPRKFGRMSHPDRGFEAVNPLCGDRIRVELRLAGDEYGGRNSLLRRDVCDCQGISLHPLLLHRGHDTPRRSTI